jgi:threonine synthase
MVDFFCHMKFQSQMTGYADKGSCSTLEALFRLSMEGLKANDRSQRSWRDLTYAELALKILSLYISPSEIPTDDLKDIIDRSYSTFRADDITPLVHLQDDNLYLLELFHGPSYSFKDCAVIIKAATTLSSLS